MRISIGVVGSKDKRERLDLQDVAPPVKYACCSAAADGEQLSLDCPLLSHPLHRLDHRHLLSSAAFAVPLSTHSQHHSDPQAPLNTTWNVSHRPAPDMGVQLWVRSGATMGCFTVQV